MIGTYLTVSSEQLTRAYQDLGDFVAIPSVSNPESLYYSMETLGAAAQFATDRLKELNFDARQIVINGSAPFVLAERIEDTALPTILLYAHYDVQPVDEDKWDSPPFVVEERDGRLYGRGASDDKAGIIGILTAIRVFDENKIRLPVNVKVLFEGEEEYGSSNMGDLLMQEAESLNAHALIVLDSGNKDEDTGTLTSSTRGVVNLSIQVNALKQPQHSGVACIAPCPAIAIASLVNSVANPEKIPGFMNEFEIMSEEERVIYRENSISVEQYRNKIGLVPQAVLNGDFEASVYERIVETPSLKVINMNAGKFGGGNSIQDSATAQISIRTTSGQDPERVGEAVKKFLESQTVPGNLPFTVEVLEACRAWKGDLSQPYAQKYLESMKENFGASHASPTGGALPLLYEFRKVFGDKMEMLPVGIEDPESNAHGHNESQSMLVFERAVNSLVSFMQKAGDR